MINLFFENLEHSLALLVFISRLGDVGTTYLATPNLKLEANPLVRKLRWPFALFTLLLCLVPYYSTALAVVIIVVSLLVSVSNSQRLWLVRTIGEDRYHDLLLSAAGKAEMPGAVGMLLLPGLFMMLLGGMILLFYPDPNFDWGYYVAMGVFLYAFVLVLYGPLSFFRLRKRSAEIEG